MHEYKNFKDLFLADFSIQNWSDLENQNIDSCEKFNDFLWRVNCCVNRHAPMKRMRKNQIKLYLKPWITNRISLKTTELCPLFYLLTKLLQKLSDSNFPELVACTVKFLTSVFFLGGGGGIQD